MNAVFVMSLPFPYGVAFSSRARNITKLLCSCGFHVHVIAPKSEGKENTDELEGCNYSVQHIYAPQNVLTLSGIGTSKPYIEAISKYIKSHKIDLIVSSSMIFVADDLCRLSKKFGIPYVIENCEWYDASTFKFGKWNPYYREHIRRIEKKNRKVDGVIAISRLFEQHYAFMGVPTVRIPTILDVKDTSCRLSTNSNTDIHIVFAGSLGKGKENMEPIFKALTRLDMRDRKICLDIYGPSKSQVLSNIGGDTKLLESVSGYVRINGRIPQDKVLEKIYGADYSIFTRPIRRSSNAGFPTKLAESMSVGTPVITNDTGDIGLYLKDKGNGLLLQEDSEEELIQAFQYILALSQDEYSKMRINARNTAMESFDYRVYVENMKTFIQQIGIK
jgi:glycosyltransferase involved in cell wall biosynthesis